MRSGIIAGALFAFVFSFENLELALFLTSPGVTTLPVAVLQYLEYHIDPLVSAVAVVQTVGIAALLLVLDRFMRLGRIVR
jgi:putative spermidine/putrescine transport system permease protein